MAIMRNNDIKTLKRRREFLIKRVENADDNYTSMSYDKAEIEALRRALAIFEEMKNG